MVRNLQSLQCLRGVAALMVVAHHALRGVMLTTMVPEGAIVPPAGLIEFGAAGVDIFFVISGFLMTYIAGPYLSGDRSAGHFLVLRAIRIWPPYAVVTAVTCLLLLAESRHGEGAPFDLRPDRLASFLFIPSFNEGGLLQPIVGPGWTLNYEALFYASFAAMLGLGRRFALAKLAAIITGLFLLGLIAPDRVLQTFLGNPILFEFLIGAAIGFAIRARWLAGRHPAAWIVAAVGLFVAFAAAGVAQRPIAYGLPAGALLIGVLGAEQRIRWPRLAVLLGDASYAVYLTHTLVIYHVTSRIDDVPPALMPFGVLLLTGSALLVAAGVGVAFYAAVERPLLRACRDGFDRLSRSRLGLSAVPR